MKAIAERDAMIGRLKECLDGEEVSFAFLFGSWARGEIFQESDADVAIYLQGDYTLDKIKGIWGKLEAASSRDCWCELILLSTPNESGTDALHVALATVSGCALIVSGTSHISCISKRSPYTMLSTLYRAIQA